MGIFHKNPKNAETPAIKPEDQVYVYAAPHQDDELLSMGCSAAMLIEQFGNENVHVLLCSDGAKSKVRKTLNNGKECGKGIHDEPHGFELSEHQFTDARDKEFFNSCTSLGYRPQNIHFAFPRLVDGSLSEAEGRQALLDVLKRFPRATICTISPFSGEKQHADHRNLGNAALHLFEEGKIERLLLFVEPYCLDGFAQGHPEIDLTTIEPSESAAEKCMGSIASYSYWNPDEGRYAVGLHSVTTEFNMFEAKIASYMHELRK